MRKFMLLLSLALTSYPSWCQNTCHLVQGVGNQQVYMCTNYAVNGDVNGTGFPSVTFADNTTNAQSINVWHTMSGFPSGITSIASGADINDVTRHYFLAAGQAIWEYLDPWAPSGPNTWVSHTEMGTSALELKYGSYGTTYAPTLWGLFYDASCPKYNGQQSYFVKYWSGSAWVTSSTMSCVLDFGIAQDESGYAAVLSGFDGKIWTSHVSGTWNTIPNTYYKYLNVGSANAGIAVDNSNEVHWFDPTALTIGVTNGQTYEPPTVDRNGRVWVVGVDGYVYEFNGSSWLKYLGSSFTTVNSCGSLCTFAMSNGTLYRFPDSSMTATATMSGNTTCKNLQGVPEQCPTSTHTPKISIQFQHGSMGGQTVTGQPVAPETQVNLSAQDTSWDLFDCLENGIDSTQCLAVTSGGGNDEAVQCTIAGGIFSAPIVVDPTTNWHLAYIRVDDGTTQQVVEHANFQCGLHAVALYTGPFDNYCNAGLNPNPPPDYSFGADHSCVTNGQIPPGLNTDIWGFDGSGPCYYPGPSGTSPAFCLHDPLPGVFGKNGPITSHELYNSKIPKDTKGPCTISGSTQ